MRKTILLTSLISLFISAPLFANQPARSHTACIANFDDNIGTLYICGFGGKFKVLSLDRCELDDSDIPRVADYLAKHPRINALDLGQNNLTDAGMAALSTNKNLAWLNVSYNQIGDKG